MIKGHLEIYFTASTRVQNDQMNLQELNENELIGFTSINQTGKLLSTINLFIKSTRHPIIRISPTVIYPL